ALASLAADAIGYCVGVGERSYLDTAQAAAVGDLGYRPQIGWQRSGASGYALSAFARERDDGAQQGGRWQRPALALARRLDLCGGVHFLAVHAIASPAKQAAKVSQQVVRLRRMRRADAVHDVLDHRRRERLHGPATECQPALVLSGV